jgi:hypothetical protein
MLCTVGEGGVPSVSLKISLILPIRDKTESSLDLHYMKYQTNVK